MDVFQLLKVPHNACHQKKETHTQRLTIKGQTLSTVDIATYLGVAVLSDLTWNTQVAVMVAKSKRTLSFIRRTVTISSSMTKAVDPGTTTDRIWCLHHRPSHTATDQQAEESEAPFCPLGHRRIPENG